MIDTRPARRLPVWDGPDRLLSSIMNNDELSENDQRMYDMLTEVWTYLKEYPRPAAKKMIVETMKVSLTYADTLIHRAESLFGDLEASRIEAVRARQIYRLEAIILNESYPLDARLKAERMLAEIAGTMRKPEDDGKQPKKRRIIRRTTDIRQVNGNVIEEAIEEEYG